MAFAKVVYVKNVSLPPLKHNLHTAKLDCKDKIRYINKTSTAENWRRTGMIFFENVFFSNKTLFDGGKVFVWNEKRNQKISQKEDNLHKNAICSADYSPQSGLATTSHHDPECKDKRWQKMDE